VAGVRLLSAPGNDLRGWGLYYLGHKLAFFDWGGCLEQIWGKYWTEMV